jgi:uncharacterized membrane protein
VSTVAAAMNSDTSERRASVSAAGTRIDSVDLFRGIIMIVMALDHVRDFFHAGALQGQDPLDFATTSPWLFLTRWITHFCAPNFSMVAGIGVALSVVRGKSKSALSWFLVTRGLWLIFLELTFLMWFGWDFEIHFKNYTFATLWALGWSMVVLAGLIRLPVSAVATFSLALILGHNAFDGIKPADFGSASWVWSVLHVSGSFKLGSVNFLAFYPLIPWVGVMSLGYCIGHVYGWEVARRKKWLLNTGLATCVAFVLLRGSNLYGNLLPWSHQATPTFTVLSFLNCTKYPPSLCYLLMTLGPGLIALSLLERPTSGVLRPALVYGRVPFFYYILHIPLVHAVGLIANSLAHHFTVGGNANVNAHLGFSLPIVYLAWICIVALLYPACRWFADLKRRRREAWLSYF